MLRTIKVNEKVYDLSAKKAEVIEVTPGSGTMKIVTYKAKKSKSRKLVSSEVEGRLLTVVFAIDGYTAEEKLSNAYEIVEDLKECEFVIADETMIHRCIIQNYEIENVNNTCYLTMIYEDDLIGKKKMIKLSKSGIVKINTARKTDLNFNIKILKNVNSFSLNGFTFSNLAANDEIVINGEKGIITINGSLPEFSKTSFYEFEEAKGSHEILFDETSASVILSYTPRW